MSPFLWPLLAALAAYLATAWWHSRKPLPAGLGVQGPWRQVANARLLFDETYLAPDGTRHCRQQIFDEQFRLISQARRLVVIDIFQFNDPADLSPGHYRPIAHELCAALLARKREIPALDVLLITDPINNVYGGRHAGHLHALEEAGIRVVITHLPSGRDPNPSWTALWRLLFRWFGNSANGGWLPNPLGPGKVTLRSYLTLLNFNANHRKTLIVDDGDDWTAVVSSANADDASSDYRDVALRFSGAAALDLLASERRIAAFSGVAFKHLPPAPPAKPAAPSTKPELDDGLPRLRILSEGAIKHALLEIIRQARSGEWLDIEVLYLAHRQVICALGNAVRRGVRVRTLLDPNHHAFGVTGSGIPNRQAARDLLDAGIALRWSDTRGEQAHCKLLLRHGGERPARLLLGSANYTRRSLDDLNFEANVELLAAPDHPLIAQARDTFARHWHNTPAEHYSSEASRYLDCSRRRYWRYRVMEASGWSLF